MKTPSQHKCTMCARMDMEGCLSKIKELSQELVQKQILGNVDEIIDKLFSEVSCLDSQNAVKIQEPQVEESAINLWNWAVTEHVGSAINGEQRAKVRHVACRLAYACETTDPKEGAIRRQILMAIKTGRSWLDTKKPASADVFFSLAVKNLELLYGRLKTRSDGQSDLNIPKGDVEKDLFRVHSYQAESAVAQADHQQAVSYVQRCKDMLLRLPKEARNYSEALQWYNYSLSFYSAGQMEQNLAKLQRNRASCFLHLQQLDKFSVYKIAVLENDADKALEAVRVMGKLAENPMQNEDRLLASESAGSNLLILAAQIALENDQQDAAMKALEYLCQQSQDSGQVFIALRCLVRLVLSKMGTITEEKRDTNLDILRSYLKMAWNSALQCEDTPGMMRDFFVLSYQISQFCPSEKAILVGQKTCLLMAAAASLELARIPSESIEQHLPYCHLSALNSKGDFSKDPTDTLLLLYEFEARAKLNDPKLETVLESVLELQQIETKTLETIASLAMEPPAHFPSLCKKALRIALSLHRKRPDSDILRCSQCLHSLIQLSLPTGVLEVESRVLEEVWGYYEEALLIISSTHGEFPEVEILWLLTRAWNTGILLYSLAQYTEAEKWCGLGMSFLRHLGSLQASYESQHGEFPEVEILWLLTRAWNTGILLYSLAQYTEAEKWCGLGMSFLRHLGSLQASYESQMSGLYTEVLDRLDKAKTSLVTEA
ncbi:UNVERIFIED_CONTAM: hypothetical protein FKN15_061509 [Acipenser sinensis]